MSKEKLEEMAKDLCQNDFCNSECKGHCRLGANSYCRDVEIIAEKLYNAGYRKQEWISVDERLPDKEGTYLTYTDKDRMLFDSFCIYPSIGTKFWIGGNGKVTHWMPLPEAPKMKGGAE